MNEKYNLKKNCFTINGSAKVVFLDDALEALNLASEHFNKDNSICSRCCSIIEGNNFVEEITRLKREKGNCVHVVSQQDKKIARLNAENLKAKKVINKKIYPYFVCGDCGNMITKETHYCGNCYHRATDELRKLYSSDGVEKIRKQERQQFTKELESTRAENKAIIDIIDSWWHNVLMNHIKHCAVLEEGQINALENDLSSHYFYLLEELKKQSADYKEVKP